MAETTTYTTLLQDVRRYTERGATLASDAVFYEQLPRLVGLAERRCARELKIEGFINVLTDTFTPGQSVYAKPDRWRDTVSFNIGTGAGNATRKFLLARSYEYCRSYWPDESQTDEPLFYGEYDYEHWLIVPTPATAMPFEVIIYEQPPLLGEDQQTNWLTKYCPDLLLYATLLESAPFLKSDDRIPVWQQLYDRAAQMLTGQDLSKILDRTAVRKEA